MAETPIIPVIPGIAEQYLQIETKLDSAAKLAYMQGKDPKYFLKASEFEVVRAYVNKLRDDVDAISNRPIKVILTSQMDDGLGSLGYIFQPGDEKKMIIIWSDINTVYQYPMLINPDLFPDNAEFRVFLLLGNNYCVEYDLIGGTGGNKTGNTALHFVNDLKTAIVRLVKYDSTNYLIINYLT